MLAEALDAVLHLTLAADQQSTRRVPSLSVPRRYYVFTVMRRNASVDYQVYRENRAQVLTAYCRGVRLKHPDAREVIGIAIEPMTSDASSQDVLYMEFVGLPTPEELANAREICDVVGIMKDSAMRASAYLAQEFPQSRPMKEFGSFKAPGNRAERRAQASAQRRKGGGKRGR